MQNKLPAFSVKRQQCRENLRKYHSPLAAILITIDIWKNIKACNVERGCVLEGNGVIYIINTHI